MIAQQPLGLFFMLRVHLMVFMLVCGDIESNPGPTRYPCKLCRKPLAKTHRALCCDECDQWVHILCAGIPSVEYERLCADSNEDQWFCLNCSGDKYQFECESLEHGDTRLLRKRQRRMEETEEEQQQQRLGSRRQRRMEETKEERQQRLYSERQRRMEVTEEERQQRLDSRQ